MEAYISHGVNIMESNQSTLVPSEEVLSPEDIAWADSCLANDIGISGNALDFWSNLTDALDETTISKPDPMPSRWEEGVLPSSQNMDATENGIFTSNPETTPPRWVDISWLSASENMDASVDGIFTETVPSEWVDNSSIGRGLATSQNMDTTVVGILTSSPETAPSGWGDISSVGRGLSTSQNMDATVDGIFTSIPETDKQGGYVAITEEVDLLPGTRFNLKNVFQPTYSEDSREGGSTSYDIEQSDASGHEQEESLEDIFKVWNLETQVEDGEFAKQINRALGGSPPTNSKNGSLDDVIRSMGDLSLNRVA